MSKNILRCTYKIFRFKWIQDNVPRKGTLLFILFFNLSLKWFIKLYYKFVSLSKEAQHAINYQGYIILYHILYIFFEQIHIYRISK